MSPFGSHARLQGCHKPDAIVVARTAVALAFLAFSLPWGWPNRPVGSIKASVNAPAENTASIRDCIRRDITRSYFSLVLLQKVGDLGDARLGARVVHLLAGPGAAYAADGVIARDNRCSAAEREVFADIPLRGVLRIGGALLKLERGGAKHPRRVRFSASHLSGLRAGLLIAQDHHDLA